MAHLPDSGYFQEPFLTLVKEYPEVDVYPSNQHGDLERVRGLLGHMRIETTQAYAQIRPAALKQPVEFDESKALDILSS